jgi:DNA-binding transcriptional LysR family regulator
MTLDQLRIFVAVADRQHVTEAAKSLNLAQSAASHAIAALEARHDTRLFDRIGRRIELTEAGKMFLVEARSVLAQVERAELVLSEIGTSQRGTLAVHASQTIASYWLPRHLANFWHAYPQIALRLAIGNTAQVADAVESGHAELGFIEGAVQGEDFESVVVARDQLVLVVGPNHPWRDVASPTAEDLTRAEWVLREPGSGTRSVLEEGLRRLHVDPTRLRVVLELPSNEAVRAAVEAGMGATAISASVAASSIEAGLLHRVDLGLPEREFHVIRHKKRYRSRNAGALLAIIEGRQRAFAVAE